VQHTQTHWVFGYGSLIWRPDFNYVEAMPARLPGYVRRFWQGSHDHRGLPERPGRVVTLVPAEQEHCIGMAYLLEAAVVEYTFEQLDHREKNGYDRVVTDLYLHDGRQVQGLVYIAPVNNFAYLGEANLHDIAHQILHSQGPSGRNIDYLLELAEALRKLNAHDEHVFELESLAQSLMETGH
jgi:glutathione-specific gamma-glutamylcyclotransferase